MTDEEAVHLEEAVEFAEAEADAAVDEGFICRLVQDLQVGANVLVSRLHVDEDVCTGSRRGTPVLVASTLDCYGDLVVFGVLDCGDDILVVVRVHDQGRMHVMVEFVSGGSILVVVVLVGLGFDCAFCCAEVLFAAEALDGSHGRSTVMWLGMASGSRCMIVGR